jgi:hypothetical protein
MVKTTARERSKTGKQMTKKLRGGKQFIVEQLAVNPGVYILQFS